MAKEQVFHHRVSGPLMRGMHHIPVDRGAGASSFRAAVQALKAGEIVGVFPEATISRAFELKDFKSGAVRMAQAADVPLIPMAIWGSQRVWTKGHPKRLGRTNTPIIAQRRRAPAGDPQGQRRAGQHGPARADLGAAARGAGQLPRPVTGDELKFVPARLGGTAPTPEEALAMDEAEAARRARR